MAAVKSLTGGGVHHSFEAVGMKLTAERAYQMCVVVFRHRGSAVPNENHTHTLRVRRPRWVAHGETASVSSHLTRTESPPAYPAARRIAAQAERCTFPSGGDRSRREPGHAQALWVMVVDRSEPLGTDPKSDNAPSSERRWRGTRWRRCIARWGTWS